MAGGTPKYPPLAVCVSPASYLHGMCLFPTRRFHARGDSGLFADGWLGLTYSTTPTRGSIPPRPFQGGGDSCLCTSQGLFLIPTTPCGACLSTRRLSMPGAFGCLCRSRVLAHPQNTPMRRPSPHARLPCSGDLSVSTIWGMGLNRSIALQSGLGATRYLHGRRQWGLSDPGGSCLTRTIPWGIRIPSWPSHGCREGCISGSEIVSHHAIPMQWVSLSPDGPFMAAGTRVYSPLGGWAPLVPYTH